jgi:hypothetical protein
LQPAHENALAVCVKDAELETASFIPVSVAGKAATRARRQEAKKRKEAIDQARARFLSPLISEAEMAGDYDRGYFAEGGFYPIDNDPKPSELPRTSNNNRALHFEVHHIDGDKSNNKDDNLEYLCKRCHMFKNEDDT